MESDFGKIFISQNIYFQNLDLLPFPRTWKVIKSSNNTEENYNCFFGIQQKPICPHYEEVFFRQKIRKNIDFFKILKNAKVIMA